MKKLISIILLFILLVGGITVVDYLPDTSEISVQPIVVPTSADITEAELSPEEQFNILRENAAAAGYAVSDSFVDSKFSGVAKVFAVKVKFNASTIASIPIVLCESEEDAIYNCELLKGGIKLPIRNGAVFSFPGKDYPEDVLKTVEAIVFGNEIPENEFK